MERGPELTTGCAGGQAGRASWQRGLGLWPRRPSRLACPSLPSCLIAMALKNSKTGSLPVSEIYSFMKEHFPYFKVSAPTREGTGATWPPPVTTKPRAGSRSNLPPL